MKETDIEISIRPITPVGNLHGFAAIKIGSIKIDDFKIVKNKNGDLFIGMPSKPDKTSDSGYRNTVVIDKDQQADFNAIVLNKYNAVIGRQLSVAENHRGTPENLRGTPENLRGSPENLRGSPENHRGSPEKQQISPENHRGSPEKQYIPAKKPPSIKEQLKKAELEAANHNAETQNLEKSKAKAKAGRDER